MLKILFIVYDVSKEGGNSLQALNLAVQISSKGYKVIIITSNINNRINTFLKKKNIKIYSTSKKNKISLNPLMKQIEFIKIINIVASKEKVNLIQLFDPISTGLVGLYSLIRFQKPIVIRLGTIFEKFYAGKMINLVRISKRHTIKKIAFITEKILKFFCIFILLKCKIVISNSSFINNHYKPYIDENKM